MKAVYGYDIDNTNGLEPLEEKDRGKRRRRRRRTIEWRMEDREIQPTPLPPRNRPI